MNSTSSTPLSAKSRLGARKPAFLADIAVLYFRRGFRRSRNGSRGGVSSSSARDNFPSNWRQIPTPPLPRWNAPNAQTNRAG